MLHLPDSAFSPGTVDVSQEADNAKADSCCFKQWHSTNYETFGRTSGYLQGAYWYPSGSTEADRIYFLYLGSIFPTADRATKAWQDASTYPLAHYSGMSSSACPVAIPAPCSRIVAQITGGRVYWLDAFPSGQCLVETAADFTPALFDAHGGAITQTLANIDQAALAAAKIACGPSAPTATATPIPPTATPTPKPKPSPKPTPKPPQPPRKKVALHFDWLAAMDGSGHASSTFRVRQDVKIVAAFSVSNLRPGKFVTVTVGRVLEVPVLGGYSKKLSNHESMAITSNGQHQSVDDTGGFTVPGRFRFVVQISLGRTALQRHVDLQVR